MEWERPDTADLAPAEVMAYIRARCPWAAAHTHTSLQKYLLEETHELVAALDAHASAGTPATRAEVVAELGDVLYQVLFHAALLDAADGGGAAAEAADGEDDPAAETAHGADGGAGHAGSGDDDPAVVLHAEPAVPRAMDEVIAGLTAKLIRRHPHVFDSDGPVELREVERRYEAVKAAERTAARAAGEGASDRAEQARASFASVPVTLPALTRAQSVLGRIDRLELPVPDPALTEPAHTEAAHTEAARPESTGPAGRPLAPGAAPAAPDARDEARAIGAELFALAVRAQAAGVDAEAALRGVTSEVEAAAIRAAARDSRGGDHP